MKATGIIVMIIGLIMTIFTAVTYFTREKVADIGSLAITADKSHHLNWSPWIGIGVMAVGGLIILVSSKK